MFDQIGRLFHRHIAFDDLGLTAGGHVHRLFDNIGLAQIRIQRCQILIGNPFQLQIIDIAVCQRTLPIRFHFFLRDAFGINFRLVQAQIQIFQIPRSQRGLIHFKILRKLLRQRPLLFIGNVLRRKIGDVQTLFVADQHLPVAIQHLSPRSRHRLIPSRIRFQFLCVFLGLQHLNGEQPRDDHRHRHTDRYRNNLKTTGNHLAEIQRLAQMFAAAFPVHFSIFFGSFRSKQWFFYHATLLVSLIIPYFPKNDSATS